MDDSADVRSTSRSRDTGVCDCTKLHVGLHSSTIDIEDMIYRDSITCSVVDRERRGQSYSLKMFWSIASCSTIH